MKIRLSGWLRSRFRFGVLNLARYDPWGRSRPSEKGTTPNIWRTLAWKPRTEPGFDCLACATCARQRGQTVSLSIARLPLPLFHCPLSHAHTRSLSLSLSLSFSRPPSLLSLTHSLPHTHTHTFSLSLARGIRAGRCRSQKDQISHSYLTHWVFEVVLQKSPPPQIRTYPLLLRI